MTKIEDLYTEPLSWEVLAEMERKAYACLAARIAPVTATELLALLAEVRRNRIRDGSSRAETAAAPPRAEGASNATALREAAAALADTAPKVAPAPGVPTAMEAGRRPTAAEVAERCVSTRSPMGSLRSTIAAAIEHDRAVDAAARGQLRMLGQAVADALEVLHAAAVAELAGEAPGAKCRLTRKQAIKVCGEAHDALNAWDAAAGRDRCRAQGRWAARGGHPQEIGLRSALIAVEADRDALVTVLKLILADCEAVGIEPFHIEEANAAIAKAEAIE